jgi:hypothetical protein
MHIVIFEEHGFMREVMMDLMVLMQLVIFLMIFFMPYMMSLKGFYVIKIEIVVIK